MQCEVFWGALRPEQYALLEHWASEEALEEHRKGMAPSVPSPTVTRVRDVPAPELLIR